MHRNLKIKHSHAKIKLNPNPHGWWSKKAIFYKTEIVLDGLSKLFFKRSKIPPRKLSQQTFLF
jgi:hypothetical protein